MIELNTRVQALEAEKDEWKAEKLELQEQVDKARRSLQGTLILYFHFSPKNKTLKNFKKKIKCKKKCKKNRKENGKCDNQKNCKKNEKTKDDKNS